MKTDELEQVPQIDNALSIEVKPPDGSASFRSQTNDFQIISAPPEVVAPKIDAGIVQRGQIACERVNAVNMSELEIVATLAGKSEIVE